jgi:hypothetical protein
MKTIILRTARILGICVLLALAVGCAKRFVITHELDKPLVATPICNIADIRDELPADFAAGKKPSVEDIDKFKDYLIKSLTKDAFFSDAGKMIPTQSQYELSGAILDYKKGSGTLRFLFGAFAGAAKVTVTLELKDIKSNAVVYSGNFTGSVTDWSSSGIKMFEQISKDFTKDLKKKNKMLLERN